jgi:hypothetical protein
LSLKAVALQKGIALETQRLERRGGGRVEGLKDVKEERVSRKSGKEGRKE